MNELIVSNFNDFVMLAGDKIVTDSRRVAKAFGKRHGDVLRAVDHLDCGADFSQRNFAPAAYTDEQGKRRREVHMTKDGFMFLVMGFTGKQAGRIKVAFIDAFNTMAEQLKRRDLGLWQQMQELIAREVESKVRASFGSRLMLERKREIPRLESERFLLEGSIQPSLLLN
ncbi:Rha family transcriptional regulator [Chromobacterium violaceum]|uniref:Rha family transcriptional regulator n=1 Tax=Chromobacterium violaceum TaxID=536 RepID=UPI001E400880|nr:Rha family transcriptional regulator [Chromobacterium violaceum]MCD0493882.1 Rha family transcriptional regulator [Chromobacterium violaceum]